MEINEITASVSKALTALEHMQRTTALNIQNAGNDLAVSRSFDISEILSAVNSAESAKSATDVMNIVESRTVTTNQTVQLDQEVVTSSQVSGRYTTLIESYNRHLALYQLALGKGK
ncbi:hypothetical protein [Pleionea sediminis]|uniref:hypothetical protein n=1 Tax=Pleionea sediminis TaxID=2569479 RepID=UPI001184A7DA|nr:hypothetical protein [Pleionea sediminis]